MSPSRWGVALTMGCLVVGLTTGVLAARKKKPLKRPPAAYATKQMPAGWWTDPDVLAAGKKIFEEKTRFHPKLKEDVQCATCHGKDGKPKKRGVKDLRSAKRVNRYSEAYWFWRVSEGVPRTKMEVWKDILTEEERWQVMAYEHTFSHGGKAAVHDHPEIESPTGP